MRCMLPCLEHFVFFVATCEGVQPHMKFHVRFQQRATSCRNATRGQQQVARMKTPSETQNNQARGTKAGTGSVKHLQSAETGGSVEFTPGDFRPR